MREDVRRTVSAVLMWASWTLSIALTVARVLDKIPVTWGASIVLLIGVAIASSLVRSRYRLVDVIVGAFEAGFRAQQLQRDADVSKLTSIMEGATPNGYADYDGDMDARRAQAETLAKEAKRKVRRK